MAREASRSTAKCCVHTHLLFNLVSNKVKFKRRGIKKKKLFGAKETEQVYKTLNNFQVKTKKIMSVKTFLYI